MITPVFVDMMAKYNHWQNTSLIDAANGLDDTARQLDRGSFFGSISATFNHLLWGDRTWLSRFTDAPGPVQSAPDNTRETSNWDEFKVARKDQDQRILVWGQEVSAHELSGDLTWYSGLLKREVTKPLALCVMSFFNHQTHHRGQIHAMLTAAEQRPEDTDLFVMPGL